MTNWSEFVHYQCRFCETPCINHVDRDIVIDELCELCSLPDLQLIDGSDLEPRPVPPNEFMRSSMTEPRESPSRRPEAENTAFLVAAKDSKSGCNGSVSDGEVRSAVSAVLRGDETDADLELLAETGRGVE